MKEDIIQSACLDYLSVHGIFAWRQNTGCAKVGGRFIRFSFKGCSDILGICPDGRFLAVECKRSEGGRLSEEQKQFLSIINSNGGVGLCVNGLEALEQGLKDKGVIK